MTVPKKYKSHIGDEKDEIKQMTTERDMFLRNTEATPIKYWSRKDKSRLLVAQCERCDFMTVICQPMSLIKDTVKQWATVEEVIIGTQL
jgi:hypothetical protein